MTFDTFIETAWSDHADRPQEVADRLAASLHIVEKSEQIPPFARLTTHVFGEHLGQWEHGIAILESLRQGSAFDGGPTASDALLRSVAVLRYASGDPGALLPLSPENRVSVLATASSAFAGRNQFKQAISAYGEALASIPPDLPANSPAIRALAIGGNNLAAALEEKKDRDASETRGMIVAAEGALKYWKQAGTWLEEERAGYRLTRSLLQAGDSASAVRSARRCIAVCADNNAPAIERFFGYAVFALALRAGGDANGFSAARDEALQLYERVSPDERAWCKTDLAELASESASRSYRMEAYSLEGGCTCGSVRYRMTSAPLFVHCCHCRWCQRETGSSYVLNAMIEADRVIVLKGTPVAVATPSNSGKGQKIARCPTCHIALWSNYAGAGDALRFVRVGTLDEPDRLPPDIHIFTASKQPWVVLPPDVPAVEEYYDCSKYWPAASLERRRMLLERAPGAQALR